MDSETSGFVKTSHSSSTGSVPGNDAPPQEEKSFFQKYVS